MSLELSWARWQYVCREDSAGTQKVPGLWEMKRSFGAFRSWNFILLKMLFLPMGIWEWHTFRPNFICTSWIWGFTEFFLALYFLCPCFAVRCELARRVQAALYGQQCMQRHWVHQQEMWNLDATRGHWCLGLQSKHFETIFWIIFLNLFCPDSINLSGCPAKYTEFGSQL